MTAIPWNLDDLPVFMAIVSQRGVTAGAESLGISKSAASKSLSRLEESLGVRLIERNSRNLHITSDGEAFYRQGMLIMEQVSEANALMSGLASKPQGKLVVALPIAFTREILAPRLKDFREQFPDIQLEIMVTSQAVNLLRDQIDLAVVIGSQNDSELIVRTLYEAALTCVTSPAYAATNRLGYSDQDLQSHIRVCETRYAHSRFPIRIDGQKKYLDLKKDTAQISDPLTVRDAVISGCGVALVPQQYCKKQLASGDLIRVFEHVEFEVSAASLSVVYPSRRLLSSKSRVFLQFLFELCAEM